MSKTRDIIAQALKPGNRGFLERYRGRELEFFKERGRLYPEKLEEVFNSIFNPTHTDLIVIGGRGVGKTMAVSDGATARFLWNEDDIFVVAGSKEQAKASFKYAGQIFGSEQAVGDSLQEECKERATGPRGNWYKIAAASEKSVRGPHPGDPHPEMDWAAHGGVLIKDERDEMDDDIALAADGSMISAEPGFVVTTSTMHRADGGGIAQMADEAEARGAKVIKIDVFDVSKICMYDCAVCPKGRKFAGALYGGENAVPALLDNGAPALPIPTLASAEAWEKQKRDSSYPVEEPAYCEGRAKLHRPGHVGMHKIFEAFDRSPNDEAFEVESCCRKRRGARRIVDGAALDRCLSTEVFYEPRYETPVITIDWGFMGWTVLILLQRQANHRIAVLEARYEQMQTADVLLGICRDWRQATGANQVAADGSHPFENMKLAEDGFEVTPVPFVKYKELGAGWVKGIVERKQLLIPGEIKRGGNGIAGIAEKPEYVFPSDGIRMLFFETRGWQRDKNGKIVKRKDHGPDSLSCAAVLFAEDAPFIVESLSDGLRPAYGSNEGFTRDSY